MASKIKILFLALFLGNLIFFPLISSANSLLPLVQCGKCLEYDKEGICTLFDECTLCELFRTIDRIIFFFLIYIVPPLAALMVAIGGFMLMIAYSGPMADIGGGKRGPGLISQAKSLFRAVIIGLVIVYGAWLIVNTFLWAIGAKTAGFWNIIQCQ